MNFLKSKGFILTILTVVAVFVLFWFLKPIFFSYYLSHKLKTSVSVGRISTGFKKMTIDHFYIKNPWGYKSGTAFAARSIESNYSFSQLFSEPTVVDTVIVNSSYLNIECDDLICSKNNWTQLLEKINKKNAKASEHEVIIKKLIIKDLNVDVYKADLLGNKSIKKIHLVNLEFDDISSKKGFPIEQLTSIIFRSAGVQDLLQGIIQDTNIIPKPFLPINID